MAPASVRNMRAPAVKAARVGRRWQRVERPRLRGPVAASGASGASASAVRLSAHVAARPLRVEPVVVGQLEKGVAVGRSHALLQHAVKRGPLVVTNAAASAGAEESSPVSPALITGSYIAMWYTLNIAFNLTNKTIFGFFPFPWTVSTVHVVVGSIYCAVTYALGLKKVSSHASGSRMIFV